MLDCSVALAWCFRRQGDRYTDSVLGSLAVDRALVPALWPLEVANVLLVAERRRQLTRSESARFLDLLGNLPIDVDGAPELPTLPPLMEIAREHRLSAYDAAYLALAARERLPLATRDTALRRSATTIGVPSFTPSDRA